jgi:hypothetical protein
MEKGMTIKYLTQVLKQLQLVVSKQAVIKFSKVSDVEPLG